MSSIELENKFNQLNNRVKELENILLKNNSITDMITFKVIPLKEIQIGDESKAKITISNTMHDDLIIDGNTDGHTAAWLRISNKHSIAFWVDGKGHENSNPTFMITEQGNLQLGDTTITEHDLKILKALASSNLKVGIFTNDRNYLLDNLNRSYNTGGAGSVQFRDTPTLDHSTTMRLQIAPGQ
jgi:hypothetical protein